MSMTREFVVAVIEDVRNKRSPESAKLELKREWTSLDRMVELACAIANTRGDQAGVILVGVDEATGALTDSRLVTINHDKVEFQQAVRKLVTPPFDLEVHEFEVEGVVVLAIEIHTSLARPHVLNQTTGKPNLIPVRKATGMYPASRADLDEMYASRASSVGRKLTATVVGPRVTFDLFRDHFGWPAPDHTPSAKPFVDLGAKKGFHFMTDLDIRNPSGEGLSVVSARLLLSPKDLAGTFEAGSTLVGLVRDPKPCATVPFRLGSVCQLYFEAATDHRELDHA